MKSIENLTKIYSPDLPSISNNKKILVIADEMGSFLEKLIKKANNNFQISFCKPYSRTSLLYTEILENKYNLIILTNNCLLRDQIFEISKDIKMAIPKLKILVLNGDNNPEFLKNLETLKIDGYLPLPFKQDLFIKKVHDLTNNIWFGIN